ncbi:MAG: hypothetical protein JWO38_2623 [Gemmataceae bacterium]|nr:hypothetical protein [Gemmataceae bacterium]
MNNSCPSCGAIYNVAAKDVGRRIKCKKCGTALVVTDAGLEVDDPDAPPRPAAARAVAEDFEDEDDVEETSRKGRDRDRRGGRAGFNPGEMLAKIGGVSTILFALGVFLVVFTGFQDAIGKAKLDRRQAAIDEGQADMDAAQRRYDDKKEKKPEDEKNITTLRENWEKRKKELEEDKKAAEVANKRSGYIDKYYMMFGFLLVAFGSLGYLLATHTLLLRIVAAIILVSMILALFKAAVGAGAGIGAAVGVG